MNVWAGVLPMGLKTGAPAPDQRMQTEVNVPKYVSDYRR